MNKLIIILSACLIMASGTVFSNTVKESQNKNNSKKIEEPKSCCETAKAESEKKQEPKSCCDTNEESVKKQENEEKSCCTETSENNGVQVNADGSVEHSATKEQKKEIGIDEKLGNIISTDLVFTDEYGKSHKLKELINRPTIIVPVYYNCPNVCHILQSAVANVLPKVDLDPRKDYQVLSVSFDATDNPKIAMQNKVNYMAAMDHKFPENSWHFLSGSQENIDKFMDAIGYRYKQVGKDFIHPVAIATITDKGKVCRYIYGSNFLPFDLTMALTEASEGRTGLSVKRLVSVCFSYDPKGKKYVFNMTRVAGSIILLFMLFIFLMLVFGGKKNKKIKG